MTLTDAQLDAYEKALAAERAVAHGTGDEDQVDHWMNQTDQASE